MLNIMSQKQEINRSSGPMAHLLFSIKGSRLRRLFTNMKSSWRNPWPELSGWQGLPEGKSWRHRSRISRLQTNQIGHPYRNNVRPDRRLPDPIQDMRVF